MVAPPPPAALPPKVDFASMGGAAPPASERPSAVPVVPAALLAKVSAVDRCATVPNRLTVQIHNPSGVGMVLGSAKWSWGQGRDWLVCRPWTGAQRGHELQVEGHAFG